MQNREELKKQVSAIVARIEKAERQLGLQTQSRQNDVRVLEMPDPWDAGTQHQLRPLTAQERARMIHRAKLTEEYGARGAELILSAGVEMGSRGNLAREDAGALSDLIKELQGAQTWDAVKAVLGKIEHLVERADDEADDEADEADELGSVAHGKSGVRHTVDRFGRLVLVDPWKTDGE